MGAQAALDAINGKPVEANIDTGTEMVTKENAADFGGDRGQSLPGPPPSQRDRDMTRITALDVVDVRFPTSQGLDGSDAMNPEPDYSAAYVVLSTSDPDIVGYSLLFTTGRGNDVACAAVRALAPYVVGRDVGDLTADVGVLARELTWDGQLRWLGPEKGVMHMAIGAVVNAAWDLRCRLDGQPLWRVLASLTPEEIVRPDRLHLHRRRHHSGRSARNPRSSGAGSCRACRRSSKPTACRRTRRRRAGSATTTTRSIASFARRSPTGFTMLKLKVGADVESDIRRMRVARLAAGETAQHRRRRQPALGCRRGNRVDGKLAQFDPYWIEEPTSPDDVLGHRAIRQAVQPDHAWRRASTCRTG